jgi:hypothetical protein
MSENYSASVFDPERESGIVRSLYVLCLCIYSFVFIWKESNELCNVACKL